MSSTESENQVGQVLTEEKLGFLFVREKIISEPQLKTALDFQKAVGKPLVEVIVSLQFVKRAIMEGVLEKHGIKEIRSDSDSSCTTESDLNKEISQSQENLDHPQLTAEPASDPSSFQAPNELPVSTSSEDVSSHTAIILDVLLRVLIRKGLIDSEEIKNELQNIEAAKST